MGHRIEVRRRFFDDTWHFDLSEPLEMVYSVFETRPAYIVSDGVRYKKTNEEGTVYSYTSDPCYAANRQIHVNENGYLWKDKSGNWRQYDNSGRPVFYGNSNNVQVTFLYGAGEMLAGLADNSGNRLLWYEYDQGGKITGVRDAASGRQVNYYYDGDKLSKVVDPLGNETVYAYDSEGRLITKQDPADRTISITYNESGYVAGVMYENGSGKLFEYGCDAGCDAGLNQSYGQIQFVNGMLKKTWFDPYGNMIKTDINGKTDYSVALVEILTLLQKIYSRY